MKPVPLNDAAPLAGGAGVSHEQNATHLTPAQVQRIERSARRERESTATLQALVARCFAEGSPSIEVRLLTCELSRWQRFHVLRGGFYEGRAAGLWLGSWAAMLRGWIAHVVASRCDAGASDQEIADAMRLPRPVVKRGRTALLKSGRLRRASWCRKSNLGRPCRVWVLAELASELKGGVR